MSGIGTHHLPKLQVSDRKPVSNFHRCRFGLSLVLVLPVLLLLPEATLDTAAIQLAGDRGALLWWVCAVQLDSFLALFAFVIVSNGVRVGWAFVIAALKSVFFAILVGVPF